MKIDVERIEKTDVYCIGVMRIDGEQICYTLEDAEREVKVWGKTAIPKGTYKVNMDTVSPKFKDKSWARPYGGKVPRLMDVPGFEGVLIHTGNSVSDTNGCLLIANTKGNGIVGQSVKAFVHLMDDYLVPAHERGEEITITIH